MIVKRVTAALRRQDWMAVAIEFFLVVAGVLLAFNINEWAADRSARSDQKAATARLLEESEQDVAYFRHGVRQHEKTVRQLSYTLVSLQNGTWPHADKSQMRSGLTASLYLDSPSPPSSVYEDIVATGMLGRIGDPPLRAAISAYRAKLALLSKLVDYVRQTAPRFDRERSLHYAYDSAGQRPARLEVDFAALAADHQMQSTLALLNDRQFFITKTWRDTLEAQEAMCRELGRVSGRPCNMNRPWAEN